MRLIDADEVRKHVHEVYQANGVELETILMVPLSVIDNAPTISPYKAIHDKLNKGGEEE